MAIGGHAALDRGFLRADHDLGGTIVVAGKWSGKLTLTACQMSLVTSHSALLDLRYTGTLSQFKGSQWIFLAETKGTGTFAQSAIPYTTAAQVDSDSSPANQLDLAATSGSITVASHTGSFDYKMTVSPGPLNETHSIGEVEVKGSWSCP
jgi:hypothetical protein